MIFKAICVSFLSKQPLIKSTQMLNASLRSFYPDNYRDCKNHKAKPSAVWRFSLESIHVIKIAILYDICYF